MKRDLLISAIGGLFLAGCTHMETNSVFEMKDGTPVYALSEQPQTSVSGEGSLLSGAYDPRQIPTGQFTGQERTPEVVGQQPTLPREADARDLDHSKKVQIRSVAETAEQNGIRPEVPAVVGSALLEEPPSPAESPDVSAER